MDNEIGSFEKESAFCMNAILLATDRADYVHAFPISLEKLHLKFNPLKVFRNGANLNISMCEMEISYKTKIVVGQEIVDTEDEN